MAAKNYKMKLVGDVSTETTPPEAQKKPVARFSNAPGHLSCPDPLAIAQSHPAYIRLPIDRQPVAVEEVWWAAVFAERGIPDPAPLEATCQSK